MSTYMIAFALVLFATFSVYIAARVIIRELKRKEKMNKVNIAFNVGMVIFVILICIQASKVFVK